MFMSNLKTFYGTSATYQPTLKLFRIIIIFFNFILFLNFT